MTSRDRQGNASRRRDRKPGKPYEELTATRMVANLLKSLVIHFCESPRLRPGRRVPWRSRFNSAVSRCGWRSGSCFYIQKEILMFAKTYSRILLLLIVLLLPGMALASGTPEADAVPATKVQAQEQDGTESTAPTDQEPVELPGAGKFEQPQDPELAEPLVPKARNVLTCTEYCGQGVSVSCSCSGGGTCSSQSGWAGWVECLCNQGTDDEEVCPGYGQGCTPGPGCTSGRFCTSGGCECGSGTCINGRCNCEA